MVVFMRHSRVRHGRIRRGGKTGIQRKSPGFLLEFTPASFFERRSGGRNDNKIEFEVNTVLIIRSTQWQD